MYSLRFSLINSSISWLCFSTKAAVAALKSSNLFHSLFGISTLFLIVKTFKRVKVNKNWYIVLGTVVLDSDEVSYSYGLLSDENCIISWFYHTLKELCSKYLNNCFFRKINTQLLRFVQNTSEIPCINLKTSINYCTYVVCLKPGHKSKIWKSLLWHLRLVLLT